ncbi:MAG: preprotein translocase subunit YajC [Microbacteriaceae bacterium]|nr:preprotein translocase subunit YajC [Microbacteriaceae bacterium]
MDPIMLALLAMLVLMLMLSMFGSRKRQKAQMKMREEMKPGVEVMLTSGIYGTLVSIDNEKNRAVINSSGSELEVHVAALAQVVPAAPDASEFETQSVETSSDSDEKKY